MKLYQTIIGYINYWIFLVLVFMLPFPQLPLRYVGTAWVISWYMELRWLKMPNLKSEISNHKFQIPFLLFGVWFLWKFISGLWAPDMAAWDWKIERYLAFLLLAPIGIWGLNEFYDWKQAGRMLVYGCLTAIPAYLIWMTFVFLHPEIVPYLHVHESWEQHTEWLTFFSENISHFKHRLFLGSVELFGAVIAWQLWKERRGLLAVLLPVMLGFVVLTDSRQAILTAAVMGIIVLWQYIPKRFTWHYWTGVSVLFCLLGFGLLILHPRTQGNGLNGLTDMRVLSYSHDVRFNIWGAALQHPGDYLAFGLGAGQSTDYLTKQYEKADLEYYAHAQYNCHNQYLEELMESGIPGLLLFLIAWLSIPLCAPKHDKMTALLFTVLFMLNMCTECMFGRFCGIVFWAAGMVFALISTNLSSPSRAA